MVDVQTIGVLVTAASVTVAAVYYVMTLRVQQTNMKATLQTREAQLFNSLYQRFSTSEYCKQFIICMGMSWENYEDFENKYPHEGYKAQQFYSLCNWYKTMNLLVEQGYVDAVSMGRLIAFDFIGFWEKFEPIVRGMRVRFGSAALLDLDLLYASMKRVSGDIVVNQGAFLPKNAKSQ